MEFKRHLFKKNGLINFQSIEIQMIFYLYFGYFLVNLLLFLKNLIISGVQMYPNPYLFCLLPLVVLFILIIIAAIFSDSFYDHYNVLILILALAYLLICQIFLFTFSVIFSAFTIGLTILSLILVLMNRKWLNSKELNRLKRVSNIEHLKLLYADYTFWLDKVITAIYWITAIFISVMAILWGLSKFHQTEFDLVIFTVGSVILYFYIMIGIFYWVLLPLMDWRKSIQQLLYQP